MTKKIVILGGSIAGVSAASKIRSLNSEIEISIITTDSDMPYNRESNPDLISGEKTIKDVILNDKSYYESSRINIVNDKKVTRINFNKRKIYSEDRSQIDFDILIITDSIENRFNDLKGAHREGLYGMRKLRDINSILENIPFFDTVVIQSGSFSGIRMANSFVKIEKETILVVSPRDGILGSIEKDVLESVCKDFDNKQLSIEKDKGIEELLGEKEIKAIKLSSGRVLATDLVVIGEAADDLRFLSDQGLNCDNKIEVDEFYRTNLENVFAVGHLVSKSGQEYYGDFIPRNVLEEQGNVIGQAVLGSMTENSASLYVSRKFKIGETSFIFIGQTIKSSKVVEIFRHYKDPVKYIKLFIRDNNVIGSILVNEDNQEDKFQNIIKEGLDVRKIESSLLDDTCSFEDIRAIISNDGFTSENASDNDVSCSERQEEVASGSFNSSTESL